MIYARAQRFGSFKALVNRLAANAADRLRLEYPFLIGLELRLMRTVSVRSLGRHLITSALKKDGGARP